MSYLVSSLFPSFYSLNCYLRVAAFIFKMFKEVHDLPCEIKQILKVFLLFSITFAIPVGFYVSSCKSLTYFLRVCNNNVHIINFPFKSTAPVVILFLLPTLPIVYIISIYRSLSLTSLSNSMDIFLGGTWDRSGEAIHSSLTSSL